MADLPDKLHCSHLDKYLTKEEWEKVPEHNKERLRWDSIMYRIANDKEDKSLRVDPRYRRGIHGIFKEEDDDS